ncbi:acrosin-like [Catharus ustulatus]|uniref:acrosin-like n=1 Tax=Catharus ustulatus TaxID=91951 RepID=UPI00140CD925|nr:acrosin-like [Catharus ustulatus]
MNRLGLLVLLTVAGLVHGLQYPCGGSCGFRAPVPAYTPTNYYYSNVYDYGLTRIVGGSNAREASWPWMVSIQHPYAQGNKHWCGGSLISSDWVLTAAHCFDKIDNISLVYVVIGATQLSRPGPGAVARTINKVVIHRDYKRIDFRYDIALMQLNQPVQCSSYIQLACVATPTLKVSELSNCWIAGWGRTTKRSADKPDNLQEAKVRLIDVQLCNSTDWYAGEIHPYNLCAGYPEGNIDSCKGDSGGPLMCQDNSADYWWVVGLTSFGNGCGRARQPGVYISTQHFYEWIDFNMRTQAVETAS